MDNVQNAVKVMAALVESGGRYIDDHNGQETSVKYAAIFQRPDQEDIIVPLLTGTYFCLNGMHIAEDGKVHLSRWSVGGVIDGRTMTLQESIDHFNDIYRPYKLVDVTEFESKPKAPVKPAFEMPQDFYAWDAVEHHDAEGTIFYRNRFNSTITGKDTVAWEIARTHALMPNNVFVREYNEAGKISHYVRMPVMEKLIQHHDFCKANGYPCADIRNLDKIKAAIAEFYQIRGIIC